MTSQSREENQDDHPFRVSSLPLLSSSSSSSSPMRKRYRSMESDLIVMVGEDHDKDGKEAASSSLSSAKNKREFHHIAAVLASQSTFIDTMLAAPMKEGIERVIRLPDLHPEMWETMIYFLQADKARRMTPSTAMELVGAYDKYGFTVGKECCDMVLEEDLKKQHAENTFHKGSMERALAYYQAATDAHLTAARQAAMKLFCAAIEKVENGTAGENDNAFTEPLLKKLGPLFGGEAYLDCSFWTPEKVSLSTFPADFMERRDMINCLVQFSHHVSEISVETPRYGTSDLKEGKGNSWVSSNRNPIEIRLQEDQWVIIDGCTNNTIIIVLMKCVRRFKCESIPPKTGWVKVAGWRYDDDDDDDAHDGVPPIIEYSFKS